MELTGRTYIFAAATLILLAGSLGLYSQAAKDDPTLALFGGEVAACKSNSVRTTNVSLGCQKDMVSGLGHGQTIARGSAKTIRIGG